MGSNKPRLHLELHDIGRIIRGPQPINERASADKLGFSSTMAQTWSRSQSLGDRHAAACIYGTTTAAARRKCKLSTFVQFHKCHHAGVMPS